MRNILLAIIATPILFGCLNKEESNLADTNSVPIITGNPAASTKIDESYEFIPNASDADGDPLSFDVENMPAWASFDSSTGKLYGEPTLADVGSYSGIVVSVSDSMTSASLPAFSVAVTETAMGTVTLSWAAPTQNSDGSALTDLAGFRIYYRKNSGSFDNEIQIDNPGITTYVVDQLSPATYAFTATAINSAGIESIFASEVTSTVQ